MSRSAFPPLKAAPLSILPDPGAATRRTFRLTEGEPLPASYGEDSYRRIFDTTELTPTAAAEMGR